MTENRHFGFNDFWSWCKAHPLFCILSIFVIIRLYIARQMPLYVIPYSMHDDALLASEAWSIMQKTWLGAYNSQTLIKGLTFPFFLIFGYLSGISYPLLLCSVNILSTLFLCVALKPLVKNKWLLGALFLLLIFSPVTFCLSTAQRVYRNSLCFALTLSVVAGFIGIYLRADRKPSALWYILTGLSLFFFVNLREDSLWLYPFIACACVLTVVRSLVRCRENKKAVLRATLLFAVTFGILILGNLVICGLNYRHYGVFVRNDRTGTSFNEVALDFLSAEYEDTEDLDPKIVLVSREKYEYVISKSPTLTAIREDMIKGYETYSNYTSDRSHCSGDFYIWGLRAGAAYAGYYESATRAADLWAQVAEELRQAYSDGELIKQDGIVLASSSAIFHLSDIPELLKGSMKDLYDTFGYRAAIPESKEAAPAEHYALRNLEILAGSFIHYPAEMLEGEIDPVNRLGHIFVAGGTLLTKIYGAFRLPLIILLLLCYAAVTVIWIRGTVKKEDSAKVPGMALLLATGLLLSSFVQQVMVHWFAMFLDNTFYVNFFYAPTVRVLAGVALGILAAGLLRFFSDRRTACPVVEEEGVPTP